MKWVGVAAAAVAWAWAASASAVPVVIDFSGDVSSGTDGGGLFTTAGSSLAGDSFTAKFVFEDALYPNYLPGVIQSASLSINGVTIETPVTPASPTNRDYGYIALSDGDAAIGGSASDDGIAPFNQIPLDAFIVSTVYSESPSLFTVFAPSPGAFGEASGSFYLDGGATSGVLDVEVGSSTTLPYIPPPPPTSPIPEPSTWALMLAGVLAIGVVFRRDRCETMMLA